MGSNILPIKTVQHPVLFTPKDTSSRHFHHGQHRSPWLCAILPIREHESSKFHPLPLKGLEVLFMPLKHLVEGVSAYYFKEAEEPRLSTLAQDPDSYGTKVCPISEFVTS